MLLDRYPECDARLDTQEKTKRKEGKKKRETKCCLQREQTVATVGNRSRLLTWEGVLEETKLRLRTNAVLVETVGTWPGPLGEE